MLKDNSLLIALRGNYYVYSRGQALFRVKSIPSGLRVTTHEKHLADPELASQVRLTGGTLDIETLINKGFTKTYKDKTTLAKMKKAAGLFSGLEKRGCHEIAVRNPTVLDCEIAFPGKVSLKDGGHDKVAPRIDLAAFEAYGEDVRWRLRDCCYCLHWNRRSVHRSGWKSSAVKS